MVKENTRIICKRMAGNGWTGLLVLLCLLLSAVAEAGVPVISNQRVTDVATRSFSVIGTVSEPSTVAFSLYSSDCATPATGAAISPPQNTASGNLRFTAKGLNAATTYCYRLSATSASTSQQATSPSVAVTTASAIVRTKISGSNLIPAGNVILRLPDVHLPSGATRDEIIVTMELLNNSAISPLSLILSNDPNRNYFNLNNLFATTGISLDLAGGERVKITEIHGASGCIIERYRTILAEGGAIVARPFARPNPNDIDASGGVNVLDILRVVAGKGTTSTGQCFNSDLDLNSHGTIDGTTLPIIKGGFNGLP